MKKLFLLLLTVFALNSCSDDSTDIENEEGDSNNLLATLQKNDWQSIYQIEEVIPGVAMQDKYFRFNNSSKRPFEWWTSNLFVQEKEDSTPCYRHYPPDPHSYDIIENSEDRYDISTTYNGLTHSHSFYKNGNEIIYKMELFYEGVSQLTVHPHKIQVSASSLNNLELCD